MKVQQREKITLNINLFCVRMTTFGWMVDCQKSRNSSILILSCRDWPPYHLCAWGRWPKYLNIEHGSDMDTLSSTNTGTFWNGSSDLLLCSPLRKEFNVQLRPKLIELYILPEQPDINLLVWNLSRPEEEQSSSGWMGDSVTEQFYHRGTHILEFHDIYLCSNKMTFSENTYRSVLVS